MMSLRSIYRPIISLVRSSKLVRSGSSFRTLHVGQRRFSVEQPLTAKAEEFERLVTRTQRTVPRKRRPVTATATKLSREPTVVTIALAESFDLQGISNDTGINGLFNVQYIDEEFDNVLYFTKRLEYTVNPTELSEMFVFDDGVVVFWNVESTQRAHLLRDLERFASTPYDSKIVMDEQDRMPFSVIEGDSCIKQDRFYLSDKKHGIDSSRGVLERFALSQGFAASVKIGVWETLLSELSDPLSVSTKALKEGVIPWNRRQALVKSGEFAALRHSINLDCNLLNRDFYWERTDIERFYIQSARHFTLNRRLSQLNSRLDYCEELVKMVDNMLALRHASTLEWMIIVLIIIEVIFDVFHFADRTPKKVIVVTEESMVSST